MALFGSLAKGIMKGVKVVGKGAQVVSKVPVVGPVLKATPVVGTALTAASVGMDVYDMTQKPKSTASMTPTTFGLPPIPSVVNRPVPIVGTRSGSNMPVPSNSGGQLATIQQAHANQLSVYGGRGRRGGMSPSMAFDMMVSQGVTLGSNYWRTKVCAPPGHVMVTNPVTGARAAVPRQMAINAGLWSPAKKPPISVKQWQALKNAKAAIKHLKKVEKAAHIVHHATTRHNATTTKKRGRK